MKNVLFCFSFLFAAFILSTQMSCAQDEYIEKPAPLKGKGEIILKRKGYLISYNKDNNGHITKEEFIQVLKVEKWQ